MKRLYPLLLLLLPVLAKAQTASFTALSDTVCQDSCITFINTSTGHIDSILWHVAGDTLSNPHSDTITVCFLTAGLDSVTLYVYDSGRVDTAVRVVTIKRLPHAMLNVASGRPTNPDTYSVANIYSSYQWYRYWASSVSSISGATADTFTADIFGYYYCAVDSGGCIGNSDTVLFYREGVVKQINPQNLVVSLYPNPVMGELTVSVNGRITNVSISNLLGQSVFTNDYNSEKATINVADLPKGIYIIRVNGTEMRKFVKE